VWDPNNVVDLLDSVANGWPIGSLLVLEGPQPFSSKKIDSGPDVSPSSVEYYLLDGQQRVTALYHALHDVSEVVYWVDLRATPDGAVPEIRWSERSASQSWRRHDLCFSVAELADRELFESRASQFLSFEVARLREVRRALLGYLDEANYTIPCIVMAQDIQLEALTRIFETLNRTGVRLDAFDLMVAVLYPQGFHLRDAWDEALARYPRMSDLGAEGLEILKLIALWQREVDRRPTSRRVSGIRQRDILNIPALFVREQWEEATACYAEALELLWSRFGVRDAGSVPSYAMVLTIAYELRRGTPAEDIGRWYWQAIVDQRYAQGANTQVLTDIDRRDDAPLDLRFGLQESLQEPMRRNRILRMGLRGLAVVAGFQDPLTGRGLLHPVRETSYELLQLRKVGAPPEATLNEMVLLSEGSLKTLRRRSRQGTDAWGLIPAALESQGFPPIEAAGPDLADYGATMMVDRTDIVIRALEQQI
jgi:hypothetical protein